jgi:copper homeostasis protein
MQHGTILEIACFSLGSAITAQAAGVDRVELCEEYEVGGVTPSQGLIEQARAILTVPIHVMIRPRGGNFVYTPDEIKNMEKAILFCKERGINGVVFGMLTPEREVDINLCRHLTQLARPMSVTFHRAIDESADMKRSILELIRIGVDRILTSGRGANALNGLPELKILQKAFGNQVILIPGGGIRASNLEQLFSSGCREYHSSGITTGRETDAEEIRAMTQLLKKRSVEN